ncbi:MAG: phage tail tube protein [Proteobacteria bacterium]|jgi:hypothetical protein|nr:phage tail tube protein [Pseudomonadota bacterium]
MTDRLVAIAINSTSDYGVTTIGTDIAGTYYKFRGSADTDGVNRTPISEENMDTMAPGEIDGGGYAVTGNIDGTLRTDPGTLNLISCFMGVQASGTTAGTYYMTNIPLTTCTLLVYDEQANDNAGVATYYTGVGMTSMEISCKVEDYAKLKFAWIGRRAITVHGALSAAPTEPTWTSFPMSVYYNAVLTFGGTVLQTKGITVKAERKYAQDYRFLGSQFLQGLYINGMSNLSGTMDIGAGEWDLVSQIINGSSIGGALDSGHTEFDGSLANTMASGELKLKFYRPAGSGATNGLLLTVTIAKCVVTDFNRSVQNRNMWEKTVNWKAALPTSADFSITVAAVT